MPFARVFEPLGVIIDLSRSTDMEVIVRNKDSRVTNTLALVSEILKAGRMEPHAAASLRGIILFMEQQIFGRCGAIATRTLSRRFVDENDGWKLSALDKKLLEWCLVILNWHLNVSSDLVLAANQSSFVRMALMRKESLRLAEPLSTARFVKHLQASWHVGLPVDEGARCCPVYLASGTFSCMGSEVLVELPAQRASCALAHRQ